MTSIDRPPPDVVRHMSGDAWENEWGCWYQEIPTNVFDGWIWEEGAPPDQGMLVLKEIERNCMVDIDVGQDGIPVVTFGLFEFEGPNLHASIFDLVNKFVETRIESSGLISGEDQKDAANLAQALERAAAIIREHL